MQELLQKIAEFFQTDGVKVAQAITVLILGLIVMSLVKGLTKKILLRTSKDKALVSFLFSIICTALYLVLFYGVIRILGVSGASVIAVFSAIALAIALGLKDSLSNIAYGILILYTKPFKVDDEVVIDGMTGVVTAVNIFSTSIVTPDNRVVTFPNSGVVTKCIINNTAKDTRRVTIPISIPYGEDLKRVKETLLEVANSNRYVLSIPAPSVSIDNFNGDRINLAVKAWTATGQYWDAMHSLLEEYVKKMQAGSFKMAIPKTFIETVTENEEITREAGKRNIDDDATEGGKNE